MLSHVTPNGTAIRAIRREQGLRLCDLAQQSGLSVGFLSRLERGEAGASDDTIRRIAEALGVDPADLTRGADDMATKAKTTPKREVPAPSTPEGELFHYTPEEAYENGFLPWKPRVIRMKCAAYEWPHNRAAGRITLTGLNIREISDMTAVRPLAETKPSAA